MNLSHAYGKAPERADGIALLHRALDLGVTHGQRVIDGRSETLRKTCDESLRWLRTDPIDVYYLHRWDKSIAIEESVGGMSRLVEEVESVKEASARPFVRVRHRRHPE